MPNIKITDLDSYSDPSSTDVLPIVDVTNDETKRVAIADLMENAGAGTEALPGIAFDGDPNTGIYRPAADELAVSTAGTQRLHISSGGVVTIPGSLTVQGTTTTIDTTNLVVEDKNIEMGSVATPSDTTADGGGITLKGATDKTINWVNSTDSWTSSEHIDIASGKTYKVAGTDVLSGSSLGSGVTGSSLTSVGTIDTGTWQGTPIATDYIADDAVTADKLANTSVGAGSYTAADITVDAQGRITAASSGQIGTTEITNLAVTTGKIADDAVTADKLANTAVTPGSYTAADITVDAQGRITSAASGTISTTEIADDAVTADKLANTAVTPGSYTAADITVDAQGRITAAASGTISTAEIANDAINGSKIADNSIDSEHYVDGSIDTVHIADDAVNASKLADTTVTAGSYTAANITVDAQGRITSAANGTASVSFPLDGGDNAKIRLGSGQDLEIFHDGSNSIINDSGTGNLQLQVAGSTKLTTTTSGIEVAGNVSVSGTVDGRDVATDGSKLDGIASNANNYSHPNHTGEVTSNGDGATTIADNVVDEANLKVSNAPTDGYILVARSANTGGMTWEAPVAGATGGGSDEIFWENGQTVTTSYTITNNKNAMSAGPITINSGVTVTIGSGENWVIV